MSCTHNHGVRVSPNGMTCLVCDAKVIDPRLCPHLTVDNQTMRCTVCDAQMVSRTVKPIEVLDAPNLAACRIPDCEGGEGCQNPLGLYVPDTGNEEWTIIGCHVTYECDRCRGAVASGGMFVECGSDHRGEKLPIPTAFSDIPPTP